MKIGPYSIVPPLFGKKNLLLKTWRVFTNMDGIFPTMDIRGRVKMSGRKSFKAPVGFPSKIKN